MIQFLGLHIDAGRARAVALGRDLEIWASAEAPVVNAEVREGGDDLPATTVVPGPEWIRAATYTLQEVYLDLPVKARKVWGIGLSAPGGWVALDFGYTPVSELRIVSSPEVADDIERWQDENRALNNRLAAILSPRDYLRFAISGGLATDVTEVDRLGLLEDGRSQWSARADEVGIRKSCRPPVFDSEVTTGRLSEEGVRRTGLPGGTWVIAGAHERAAAVLGAADPRRDVLWKLLWPGHPTRLVRGVPAASPAELPEPWQLRRSGIGAHCIYERELSPGEDDESIAAELDVLTAAGLPTEEAVEVEADPALGAAALAAIGSGLVKGWDRYYAALDA